MSNSIDALDLPIQFFAVGTVLGMTSALIWLARTGDLDYWPVFVAVPAIAPFLLRSVAYNCQHVILISC
jgi:hypothetical protein